jgi:GTPase
MFYDRAKIHVTAGKGGNGAMSFRREKHVPHGGPDGGDGGSGGSVYLRADPQLRDLSRFGHQVHFKAESGKHGEGARRLGASGADLDIDVPLGTEVWRDEELLADLVVPGQRVLVAAAGVGGRGNTRFATAVRQSPKFAEFGETGDEGWLTLTLKLMADVGLAGLPNAGKSSLLRRISNAKPKVADYPFTTLTPMLGVVEVPDEERTFIAADVPGLLEGASEGVGLGMEFLAHLERCRLLLHLVDVTGYYGSEPLENFRTILAELDAHTPELAAKPQLVVLNKIDAVDDETSAEVVALLQAEVVALRAAGHPAYVWNLADDDDEDRPEAALVWVVSAVTGKGVNPLVRHVGHLLELLGPTTAESSAAEGPGYGGAGARLGHASVFGESAGPPGGGGYVVEGGGHVVYRPTSGKRTVFVVRKEGDVFLVEGEAVERLVRRYDLTNPEAARYLAQRLEHEGVYAALREHGAEPGDEVDIDGFVFEYQ